MSFNPMDFDPMDVAPNTWHYSSQPARTRRDIAVDVLLKLLENDEYVNFDVAADDAVGYTDALLKRLKETEEEL